MIYPQAGIHIHCIPTRGICIMACTNGTFASWHIPKRTFAPWHAPGGHLHHDILTRSICIMTYPLEGICTTRFLHLHLCKETFASQLGMCAGTITDKPCICTPAWDICIIAYLQRSICIMTYPLEGICTTRFLHLYLCKETFASQLNMCAGTIMDKLYKIGRAHV